MVDLAYDWLRLARWITQFMELGRYRETSIHSTLDNFLAFWEIRRSTATGPWSEPNESGPHPMQIP
jgi:hypothetical protein